MICPRLFSLKVKAPYSNPWLMCLLLYLHTKKKRILLPPPTSSLPLRLLLATYCLLDKSSSLCRAYKSLCNQSFIYHSPPSHSPHHTQSHLPTKVHGASVASAGIWESGILPEPSHTSSSTQTLSKLHNLGIFMEVSSGRYGLHFQPFSLLKRIGVELKFPSLCSWFGLSGDQCSPGSHPGAHPEETH